MHNVFGNYTLNKKVAAKFSSDFLIMHYAL